MFPVKIGHHERVQEALKYPKSVEEDLWAIWNRAHPELLCSSENIYQVQLILLEYFGDTLAYNMLRTDL